MMAEARRPILDLPAADAGVTLVALHAGNPGPMTGSGNWTYLLSAQRRALLIDAGVGLPAHLDAIDEALTAQGATLDRVLVTHSHSDHISGAAAVARRHPQAAFWRGRATAPTGGPAAGTGDAAGDLRWQVLAEADRIPIGDSCLTAVHTPGHAPDHFAFWMATSRIIFAGDLVMPGGTVTIPFSRGGDLAAYLASIERLLSLAPRHLLPAHGKPPVDPLAALRAHIAHRLDRERQVLDRLRAGESTVEALTGSIYDGLPPALLPAARENVRAHLEKLRQEGHAVECDSRWRVADRPQESSPQ